MEADRWKLYKKRCKKYGPIKWHVLCGLSPFLFILLGVATLFKIIGLAGEWLEKTILSI